MEWQHHDLRPGREACARHRWQCDQQYRGVAAELSSVDRLPAPAWRDDVNPGRLQLEWGPKRAKLEKLELELQPGHRRQLPVQRREQAPMDLFGNYEPVLHVW